MEPDYWDPPPPVPIPLLCTVLVHGELAGECRILT